ncbi:hypothetical protein AKJ39_02525 [candidate division MSBL1 archaeon SCGC-AAA259J03]|uniref:Uncharacterized protein n=2 Tax=candidate division MSBL1 TaxID=215777 RepID=A0A656YZA7_9EURY|nr:hypothetical protein AKJ61_02215 [candidate division MSBL1 archaeon SCGC-AAA259B11]KXA98106.1 hypothetical protein AKJ39_02525 [candidate division MSBL1 archaeon SCGC-AAA259J03]
MFQIVGNSSSKNPYSTNGIFLTLFSNLSSFFVYLNGEASTVSRKSKTIRVTIISFGAATLILEILFHSREIISPNTPGLSPV